MAKAVSLSSWLACLAGIIFLTLPLGDNAVFVQGDLGNYHLPLRAFVSEQLHSGDSPLWDPLLYTGFYLHGEGSVGLFHPIHWLLYRILPLPIAYGIELALFLPFAFLGMRRFLRHKLGYRVGENRGAASFGGLVFAAGSALWIGITHPDALQTIAHLPWCLLLLDSLLNVPTKRGVRAAAAGLAMTTGSMLLIGNFAYSSLVAFVSLGWMAWFHAKSSKRVGWIFFSILCGIGIGSVQAWPTWQTFLVSEFRRLSFPLGDLGPAALAFAAAFGARRWLHYRRLRPILPVAVLLVVGALAWSVSRLEKPIELSTYLRDVPLPPPAPGERADGPNLFSMKGTKLVGGVLRMPARRVLAPGHPSAKRFACYAWRLGEGLIWVKDADTLPRFYLAGPPSARELASSIDELPPAINTKVRIERDLPGEMIAITEAEGPTVLVVSESFHKGWNARIDGKPAPLERAHGDFLGLAVPPGQHRIDLEFMPTSLLVTALLSILSFLSAATVLVAAIRSGPRYT